ncbi:MAG TPA: hypothetical protein EYP46_02090 [Hadesarchaea archaeon]|nr:hypothetical protein [Hadesarchaea archaeon]
MLFVAFLSVMLVWSPWKAVDSRVESALGWPAQYTRGISFGVDLIGGSRIILGLEAYHVTFEINQDNVEDAWSSIVSQLEDNLYVSIKTINLDSTIRQVAAEIGKPVTQDMLEAIIGDLGSVVKIEKAISETTRDDVISILAMRVDPYGILGVQFRALGSNLVLFEAAGLSPEQAKTLLGKPGRLEIFFENNILLRGEDVVSVGAPYPSTERAHTANLPFRLTDEGAARFREAAAGKANYPTVIYVDRPTDSIVVFDSEILSELPPSIVYDANEKMFKEKTEQEIEYPINVLAVGTDKNELSHSAQQFLEEQAGLKLKVLLLGDFSSEVIENISQHYVVEDIGKLTNEGIKDWIERACGLKSVVTISPALASDLAAGKIIKDMVITIARPSLDEAMNEAKNLRLVLSERLPVNISYESETSIDARLGTEFLRQAIIAGIAALVGVLVLVYLRYLDILIGFSIVGTMTCELIITLGVASVLHWSIGLPELGGLIIVIGTGVDHQIIITDEIRRGGLPEAKTINLGGRVSRAFAIIFVAVATTVAAMMMLAWLGFGAMRGFAIITIVGLLIAVFLTRPVYARIVSGILAWRHSETVGA